MSFDGDHRHSTAQKGSDGPKVKGPTRPSDGAEGNKEQQNPLFPKIADRQWLYEKRVVEGLTYQQIADIVGCSRQRVHQRAVRYGLCESSSSPTSPTSGQNQAVPLRGLLRSKRLRGTHAGTRIVARVLESGRIQVMTTGQIYDTPDEAATAACAEPADGWAFWHFKNEQRTWAPLGTVRVGAGTSKHR